jgi:esterase/lipase superfamily enzyme
MRFPVARTGMPAVGMLAVLLGGCAALQRPVAHVAGVADTVYYLSARAREAGRDTRTLADTLEYGLVVMRRHVGAPDDLAISRDIIDSTLLDSLAFTTLLRERVRQQRAPFDFAVLYVHGMGTSLHEAWQHTAAARGQAGHDVPWVAFCWPATGSGVAWPRSNALLTAAYRRDSLMADESRPLFATAMAAVRRAVPSDQLILASHSLGGQLTGDVLRTDTTVRAELLRSPLRAVAFLMPDVDAARFRDSVAVSLPPLAHRRVLYVSRNDRALQAAGLSRNSDRAGLRNDDSWVPPAASLVETVDVTRARTTEGWFQRHFGTHHAIKRQTGLLFDLVHVIGTRRNARCRERTRMAVRADDDVQELQPLLPPVDSVLACPVLPPEQTP